MSRVTADTSPAASCLLELLVELVLQLPCCVALKRHTLLWGQGGTETDPRAAPRSLELLSVWCDQQGQEKGALQAEMV